MNIKKTVDKKPILTVYIKRIKIHNDKNSGTCTDCLFENHVMVRLYFPFLNFYRFLLPILQSLIFSYANQEFTKHLSFQRTASICVQCSCLSCNVLEFFNFLFEINELYFALNVIQSALHRTRFIYLLFFRHHWSCPQYF